jgi:hypothetical protein
VVKRWFFGYFKILGAAWLCCIPVAFANPGFRDNLDVLGLLVEPLGMAFFISLFGFAAMFAWRNAATGGVRQGIITVISICIFLLVGQVAQ